MRRTALIVDPNIEGFEILNEFFASFGYEVYWVKDIGDVESIVKKISPTLVILESLQTKKRDDAISQAIRKLSEGQNSKIVLLSDTMRQEEREDPSGLPSNVDAYARKPMDPTELETVLRRISAPGFIIVPEKPIAPDASLTMWGDRSSAGEEFPHSGEFAEIPFPKILFYIYKYSHTGILRVTSDKITKVIYFRKGKPVFVTSNIIHESLGRYLVETSQISVEDYNVSLDRMLSSGKQHGAVLMEMNKLTPHQLFEALKGQISEKILKIFGWDEGSYQWESGETGIDQNLVIELDTLQLIFQGIKRFYTLSRLEQYFNKYKNRQLGWTIGGRSFALGHNLLGTHDQKFLKVITGDRSIGRIISYSNLSLTETFQVLYFLILIEVLEYETKSGVHIKADATIKKPKEENEFSFRKDAKTAPSEKLENYQRTVDRYYDAVKIVDHYKLFGIPKYAPSEAVKIGYHFLTHKIHAYDIYMQADDVTKAKADVIFRHMTDAYVLLSAQDKKKSYDDWLKLQEAAQATQPEPAVSRPAQHEEPMPVKPQKKEPGQEIREREKEPHAAEEPSGISSTFNFDYSAEPSVSRKTKAEATQIAEKPILAFEEEEEAKKETGAEFETETPDKIESQEEFLSEQIAESTEITHDVAKMMKSELFFQKGEKLLRDKKFVEAAIQFKKALELVPDDSEYLAYFGWAIFRSNPNDRDKLAKATAILDRALGIHDGLDSAHYFYGIIHKFLGNKMKARESFLKALKYNPYNKRAEMELDNLDKRQFENEL